MRPTNNRRSEGINIYIYLLLVPIFGFLLAAPPPSRSPGYACTGGANNPNNPNNCHPCRSGYVFVGPTIASILGPWDQQLPGGENVLWPGHISLKSPWPAKISSAELKTPSDLGIFVGPIVGPSLDLGLFVGPIVGNCWSPPSEEFRTCVR